MEEDNNTINVPLITKKVRPKAIYDVKQINPDQPVRDGRVDDKVHKKKGIWKIREKKRKRNTDGNWGAWRTTEKPTPHRLPDEKYTVRELLSDPNKKFKSHDTLGDKLVKKITQVKCITGNGGLYCILPGLKSELDIELIKTHAQLVEFEGTKGKPTNKYIMQPLEYNWMIEYRFVDQERDRPRRAVKGNLENLIINYPYQLIKAYVTKPDTWRPEIKNMFNTFKAYPLAQCNPDTLINAFTAALSKMYGVDKMSERLERETKNKEKRSGFYTNECHRAIENPIKYHYNKRAYTRQDPHIVKQHAKAIQRRSCYSIANKIGGTRDECKYDTHLSFFETHLDKIRQRNIIISKCFYTTEEYKGKYFNEYYRMLRYVMLLRLCDTSDTYNPLKHLTGIETRFTIKDDMINLAVHVPPEPLLAILVSMSPTVKLEWTRSQIEALNGYLKNYKISTRTIIAHLFIPPPQSDVQERKKNLTIMVRSILQWIVDDHTTRDYQVSNNLEDELQVRIKRLEYKQISISLWYIIVGPKDKAVIFKNIQKELSSKTTHDFLGLSNVDDAGKETPQKNKNKNKNKTKQKKKKKKKKKQM